MPTKFIIYKARFSIKKGQKQFSKPVLRCSKHVLPFQFCYQTYTECLCDMKILNFFHSSWKSKKVPFCKLDWITFIPTANYSEVHMNRNRDVNFIILSFYRLDNYCRSANVQKCYCNIKIYIYKKKNVLKLKKVLHVLFS